MCVRRLLSFVAAMSCASSAASFAANTSFASPDLDRPVYPFIGGASGATRNNAATFGNPQGAIPFQGVTFDERDEQFLLGFNTAAKGIPTNQGAANYQITSVTMTVVVQGGTFNYDPTTDAYTSYLNPTATRATADSDTGRPIEVFGVGYRNGYTGLDFTGGAPAAGPGYEEAENFGAATRQGRSIFAADVATGSPRDVSNNLDYLGPDVTEGNADDGQNGFNAGSFAVGQAALANGAAVPANTTFTFTINVNDANIQNYLRTALNSGQLGLMISSLHPAPAFGQGDQTYPSYYTREAGAALSPTLNIAYTLVPEPSSAVVLAAGALMIGSRRRRD